ncbi:hypothetical protein VNO78_03582 [Psophocarpus tetragonolobus]|uniref:Uncharacterized protein n=1 Tax=Psophocarpus tetragonolobus TaxID=3891 RepID=A0AAN9T3C5_PSOTE
MDTEYCTVVFHCPYFSYSFALIRLSLRPFSFVALLQLCFLFDLRSATVTHSLHPFSFVALLVLFNLSRSFTQSLIIGCGLSFVTHTFLIHSIPYHQVLIPYLPQSPATGIHLTLLWHQIIITLFLAFFTHMTKVLLLDLGTKRSLTL